MTPDPISDEARKLAEELRFRDEFVPDIYETCAQIAQRYMTAYAIAYHEAKSKELVEALEGTVITLKGLCSHYPFLPDERKSMNDAKKLVEDYRDAARKERE